MAALQRDLDWALSLGGGSELRDSFVPAIAKTVLAAAVIRMVHADATRIAPMRPGGWRETIQFRRCALAFCFSAEPDLTAWRIFWTIQAGYHPDRLRREILDDCRILLAGGRKVNKTGEVKVKKVRASRGDPQ